MIQILLVRVSSNSDFSPVSWGYHGIHGCPSARIRARMSIALSRYQRIKASLLLIINFSLPNEITSLPTKMHSLPTFSIFAQTPPFFAQTPLIFAQPSTFARPPAAAWISGSWNTPIQMKDIDVFLQLMSLSCHGERNQYNYLGI